MYNEDKINVDEIERETPLVDWKLLRKEERKTGQSNVRYCSRPQADNKSSSPANLTK